MVNTIFNEKLFLCDLSSALSYLLKSIFILLLLMINSLVGLCSNSCAIVFMTKKKKEKKKEKEKKKKKKNTVNVLKISTHFFFFFLFLQNANKCICNPRTYVVEVVPEQLYTYSNDGQFETAILSKDETSRPRRKNL